MRYLRRKYLDLAWWADGVPALRKMKCIFGRHCPIMSDGPDGWTGNERCAWCGKDLGLADLS